MGSRTMRLSLNTAERTVLKTVLLNGYIRLSDKLQEVTMEFEDEEHLLLRSLLLQEHVRLNELLENKDMTIREHEAVEDRSVLVERLYRKLGRRAVQ